MTTLVMVFRIGSLLVFAAPMSLALARRSARPESRLGRARGTRAPLAGNLAAFGVFVPVLLVFSDSPAGATALLLAASGFAVAWAGTALVLKSRAELGAAWSFVPTVDHDAGLVATGPYRLVRHPIYLGLALVTVGQALAFGSWPALTVALGLVVPTLAWRGHAEERLLGHTFGERYDAYRRRTRLIIPRVL